MQKTMGRPVIDFYFSLLAPISNGEVELLNDDDGDDEWIMFQLWGDAKSQELDLLQSGIIKRFRWNKGFKNQVSFQNKSDTT